jgi:hypothetical protein
MMRSPFGHWQSQSLFYPIYLQQRLRDRIRPYIQPKPTYTSDRNAGVHGEEVILKE